MSALQPPRLYDPQNDKHLLHDMTKVHMACITEDHALLSFLPPLSHDKILASWASWSQQVEQGKRVILMQMAPAVDRESDEVLAGVVSLSFSSAETGPHRSEVGRLLVSPDFRYRGIARRLMAALEPIAVERGGWLMMLDTVVGSGADTLYPKLGYKEMGRIPKYGYSPEDGRMVDEVFFYKDLKHGQTD